MGPKVALDTTLLPHRPFDFALWSSALPGGWLEVCLPEKRRLRFQDPLPDSSLPRLGQAPQPAQEPSRPAQKTPPAFHCGHSKEAICALIKFLFNIFSMINDPTASFLSPDLRHKIFLA